MFIETLILTSAVLSTVLLVGIFLAFSLSINSALKDMTSATYVGVMQAINRKIQNPIFLSIFMLPVLLLPLSTFLYSDAGAASFMLMLGASALYIAGTFGITVAGNVPLNNKLDTVDLSGAADLDKIRLQYAKKWNRLHTIRTLAGVFSAVCLILAILI